MMTTERYAGLFFGAAGRTTAATETADPTEKKHQGQQLLARGIKGKKKNIPTHGVLFLFPFSFSSFACLLALLSFASLSPRLSSGRPAGRAPYIIKPQIKITVLTPASVVSCPCLPYLMRTPTPNRPTPALSEPLHHDGVELLETDLAILVRVRAVDHLLQLRVCVGWFACVVGLIDR